MSEVIRESSTRAPGPNEAAGDLLTKEQLAKRANVSLRTIETWMSRKLVPHIKIKKTVRFIWPDVEQTLKRGFGVGYGPGAIGKALQ